MPQDQNPADSSSKPRPKGYKAMKASPDARHYEPSAAIAAAVLPPKVDLRPHMTPILNQGDTNSCVAHAVAGTYDYWVKKLQGKDVELSRLFVYYNARWRDNCQDKDEGATIQFAVDSLGEFGVCTEGVWPFNPKVVNLKPNPPAYQEGVLFRVQSKRKVPTDLTAWKQSLAQGLPIVFGCLLFDSFDDCTNRGGVVPMPDPKDVARAEHDSHAMCCVGYSDVEKVFIVRNSWGPDWGDQGYCYMPYNYLMSDKFNDGDCWVFQPDQHIPDVAQAPANAAPQRTGWVFDQAPVTNGGQGVDFEINPHDVAAYAGLAINLFEALTHEWHDNKPADYQSHSTLVAQGLFHALEQFGLAELQKYANSQSAGKTGPADSTPKAVSGDAAASSSSDDSGDSDGDSSSSDDSGDSDGDSSSSDGSDDSDGDSSSSDDSSDSDGDSSSSDGSDDSDGDSSGSESSR